MPSATFFNLPPEKREKLLHAARAEFTRTDYAQASVNRMIQDAGIPRGSFYMYFTDKEDLFHYLLGVYGSQLKQLVCVLLERDGGDLFGALLAAFDHVTGGDQVCAGMMDILRRNWQLRPDLMFAHPEPDTDLSWLEPSVDMFALDIRQEEDFPEILRVLLSITGGAVLSVARGEDIADTRAHLHHVFEILRRGMAVKPSQTA